MTAEQPSTPKKSTYDPVLDPRTPVEILKGDTWEGGYIVRDASDPHAITVERVGNPMILIRNLRLDLDLRVTESAFSTPDILDF